MTIRRANENDYSSIVTIRKALSIPWPEKIKDAEVLKIADKNRSPTAFCKRWLAEENNEVLGFISCVEGAPYNGRMTLMLELSILPNYRNHGLGHKLFSVLYEKVKLLSPAILCADSFSIFPEGAPFLSSLGFRETWKESPVVLDIEKARLDNFEKDLSQAQHKGFSFKTVQELKDIPMRDQRLYDLYIKLSPTVPSEEGYIYEAPTFSDWRAEQIEDPAILLDAYQIVLKDGEMIGLKEVGLGNDNSLSCGLMGVLPEYRRQGLAKLMQMKTIQYAKEKGIQTLRSCTATRNLPMQELYASLGYNKLYEWTQHMLEI